MNRSMSIEWTSLLYNAQGQARTVDDVAAIFWCLCSIHDSYKYFTNNYTPDSTKNTTNSIFAIMVIWFTSAFTVKAKQLISYLYFSSCHILQCEWMFYLWYFNETEQQRHWTIYLSFLLFCVAVSSTLTDWFALKQSTTTCLQWMYWMTL